MKKNESNLDRGIRVVLAVVLAFVAMNYLSGWLMILFYILAVVMLVTAVIGFCGLYSLLGISTKK